MDTSDKEEKGLAELAGHVEDEKNQDNAIMPKDDSAEKVRWLFRGSERITIH